MSQTIYAMASDFLWHVKSDKWFEGAHGTGTIETIRSSIPRRYPAYLRIFLK